MKSTFKAIFFMLTIVTYSQESSLSAGYGNRGLVIGIEYKFNTTVLNNFKPLIYADFGLNSQKFKIENITFNGDNYSSDTRVIFGGIGLGLSYENNKFALEPAIGLKYAYARFKDKALVNAIGENGIIRYHNGYQVGPKVENGYGDTYSFEFATTLEYKISENISIYATPSISPIKFGTSDTLFGEYWGESPIENDYFINFSIFNIDAGLQYHF